MGADESSDFVVQQPIPAKTASTSGINNEEGIFETLRRMFNTNALVENGIVHIDVSSSSWKDPTHLIERDWSGYWYSGDEENSSITVEFLCCTVSIDAYSIKTYQGLYDGGHMQSWVLEGSNDGSHWIILDERRRDSSLNGQFKEGFFNIAHTIQFKMLRITQTERNTFQKLRFNMILKGIEFYGDISPLPVRKVIRPPQCDELV